MTKKKKESIVLEEISTIKIEEKNMVLFDKSDKPFLTLYLFIFIFGIIITIISV